jgi:DNA-binding winged helix-turn-helix (wHTH) protein/tetratricopeptide (TPR) repeat protein
MEADGTLLRKGVAVHLPPKELAALRLLIEHAGQIVTPLQLKNSLWDNVHVTADSVPKCLSALRARLEPEQCIQTVYKRGYRFSAEVRRHGAAAMGTLPRLAIVPFSPGYAVPEHLGQAIAEEVILRLTGAPHAIVSVMARDSVFALAEFGQTAQQIGEALKADLVLTGTLRAMAAHFRLRVEMIRVKDGTQIWVEDFLAPQSSIVGIEAELVQRLTMRLNSGGLSIFAAAEPFVERRKRPERREAYKAFLRGHFEWRTLQRHRMQDGLQHLQRAIELDPSLTPARVDMVNACVAQALYGFMSPAVAAESVRRTVESTPDLQLQNEAILPALGWINFHVDRDLPAALRAFSQSAHLPHEIWTTHLRVIFALSRRRFPEAIGLLRAALQVDPYSPWLHARQAWAYHLAGKAAESVDLIRRTIDLFPLHEGSIFYGALILAFNGEATQATELAHGLSQRLAYFDLATAVHAYALACQGRNDEARAILERLQWLSRERFVLRSFTPAVYVALGDHDSALAELRTAADARCPWFFQMLADPRLKPLHGNPEFEQLQSILTRMEDEAAEVEIEPTFE